MQERSVCPSCGARRAALAAAHLTDNVLPQVGYRQWTLAFPRGLRVALALDAKLLGQVLGGFVRAVFALKRRSARAIGLSLSVPPGLDALLSILTSINEVIKMP